MDPQLQAIRQAQRDKFLAQKKAAEEVGDNSALGAASEPSKRKAGGILEGLPADMLHQPISALLADAPLPTPKRVRVDPNAVRVPAERTAEIRRLLAEPAPIELRIMSWNIDGLDEVGGGQALMLRTLHAALVIARHLPAVVLLQEAIPPSLEILSAMQVLGGSYEIITPSNPPQPYYVAILLHKKFAKKLDCKEVTFPTSKMGRQLLAVKVEFPFHGGPALVVSTAHLESTKDHAQERKRQLSRSFRFLKDSLSSLGAGAALLVGDLNLRDAEVRDVQMDLQTEADGIADAWSFCGSPADARWTWDTVANDNLDVPFKCQSRFDRLFFLSPGVSDLPKARAKAKAKASAAPIEASAREGWRPTSFKLVGQERVPGLGRFPSDHWGLLTAWTAGVGPALKTGSASAGSSHNAAAAPGATPVEPAACSHAEAEVAVAAPRASSAAHAAAMPASSSDDTDADFKAALALSLAEAPASTQGAVIAAAASNTPSGGDDDEDADLKAAMALSVELNSNSSIAQDAAPKIAWSSLSQETDVIDLDG